jgi:hypothetical protein
MKLFILSLIYLLSEFNYVQIKLTNTSSLLSFLTFFFHSRLPLQFLPLSLSLRIDHTPWKWTPMRGPLASPLLRGTTRVDRVGFIFSILHYAPLLLFVSPESVGNFFLFKNFSFWWCRYVPVRGPQANWRGRGASCGGQEWGTHFFIFFAFGFWFVVLSVRVIKKREVLPLWKGTSKVVGQRIYVDWVWFGADWGSVATLAFLYCELLYVFCSLLLLLHVWGQRGIGFLRFCQISFKPLFELWGFLCFSRLNLRWVCVILV